MSTILSNICSQLLKGPDYLEMIMEVKDLRWMGICIWDNWFIIMSVVCSPFHGLHYYMFTYLLFYNMHSLRLYLRYT